MKNRNESVDVTNKVILSLTQDLQRLPLQLVDNLRGRYPAGRPFKYGMTALFNNSGFTLIELLVVVLIIGILAAVAVPQYQKAVVKSRLMQWATHVSNIDKALNIWKLSNNIQEDNGTETLVYFTGENPTASLDIDLPCTSTSGHYCYTDIGRFSVGCSSNNNCWIDFATDNGPFPPNESIWTSKYADGRFNNQRILTRVPSNSMFRKIVCQYWVSHYGKEYMNEEVLTNCVEVGI